eukprot:Sspe_Gene.45686::Locus_22669_Transcript_2_2_Confidence_0.400_Length_1508::g.45686::m.45686
MSDLLSAEGTIPLVAAAVTGYFVIRPCMSQAPEKGIDEGLRVDVSPPPSRSPHIPTPLTEAILAEERASPRKSPQNRPPGILPTQLSEALSTTPQALNSPVTNSPYFGSILQSPLGLSEYVPLASCDTCDTSSVGSAVDCLDEKDHLPKYFSTRFGAMSEHAVREEEDSIKKKIEQLSLVKPKVVRSKVMAVHPNSVTSTSSVFKIVHFVRHGEGTSNHAARKLGRDQYKSNDWRDARLTDLGWKQACDIAAYVKEMDIKVDLVVTSPLRRAATTGLLVFASCRNRDDNTDCAPMVACELLRERAHGNPCDKRIRRSQLQQEVPMVDFSMIQEEDPFQHFEGAHGEKWEDTAERARSFLKWLRERDETRIAVATHSAFLLVLFQLVLDCRSEPELTDWFETCELRTVALLFPDGDEL